MRVFFFIPLCLLLMACSAVTPVAYVFQVRAMEIPDNGKATGQYQVLVR